MNEYTVSMNCKEKKKTKSAFLNCYLDSLFCAIPLSDLIFLQWTTLST